MVTCERWVAMVRAAAGQVRASQELLSNLDSHGGDGDHGTTMVRAMNCIEQAVAQEGHVFQRAAYGRRHFSLPYESMSMAAMM